MLRGASCEGWERASVTDAALWTNVCYSKLAETILVWMIEVYANENSEASRFESLSRWIKLNFTRHEIWVLKAARRVPFFALFAFGTLWLWFFLPMLPVGILLVILFEDTGIFGAVFNMVLGLVGLVIVAPWFFRWYFICTGLMFGRAEMAQFKQNEVSDRLERLVGTQAASDST
ncbi:hypothetical protein GCM10011324_18800 [Allosediminivita pacifica]|nr:hypothetical protein GCM10011324_18800 [Allosediminivita pacifica]